MDLLIISDSFLPRWDGISKFLYEILPELNKRYRVTLIVPRFGNQKLSLQSNIIHMPLSRISISGFTFAKPHLKIIKREIQKNDVIWVQSLGPLGILGIKYAKKYNKRLINYVHSFDWELFSKSITKKKIFQKIISFITKTYVKYWYNKVDLLIVPYNKARSSLKKIGVKKDMITIKLGISKCIKPAKNKTIIRQNLGLDLNKILIGYVGRITIQKDLETLRKAFIELRQKYNNISLIIIGSGNRSETKTLAGKDIKILGQKENINEYLKALDIFVMPSLTETTSLATLEAMAAGLAVVATPVGHIPDYARHKHNALLFKPRDYVELYHHLELLINNDELRKRLGKRARESVINKGFLWKNTINKLIILFEKINMQKDFKSQ